MFQYATLPFRNVAFLEVLALQEVLDLMWTHVFEDARLDYDDCTFLSCRLHKFAVTDNFAICALPLHVRHCWTNSSRKSESLQHLLSESSTKSERWRLNVNESFGRYRGRSCVGRRQRSCYSACCISTDDGP